ncbi:uncharacterized protein [Ambystoma mexicanum]|uniref:uncharacterized protein n=1 Tax=Ambystoma mexicanum TaxID=8296 RepID=UPI0037E8FCA2
MATWQLICHGLLVLTLVSAGDKCANPEDTDGTWKKIEATLGSRVLLPCAFGKRHFTKATSNTSVVWKKDSEYLVQVNVLAPETRFWGSWGSHSEVGSKNGSFSFVLKELRREDVGNFSCVLYEGVQCVLATQWVRLTLAPPSGTSKHFVGRVLVGVYIGILLLIPTVAAVVYHGIRARRAKTPSHQSEYHNMAYHCPKAETTQLPPYNPDCDYLRRPAQQEENTQLPPYNPAYDYLGSPAAQVEPIEIMENPIYI